METTSESSLPAAEITMKRNEAVPVQETTTTSAVGLVAMEEETANRTENNNNHNYLTTTAASKMLRPKVRTKEDDRKEDMRHE
mmetsp:Transcript_12493/g.29286  ORF Transcript_12493/g.29286 Transcript_12493/m.29286 type:complete len:83 (-) Transcript_12493:2881-3129(-)